MIIDKGGNLYGTTTAGGEYSSGTAFELTPGSGGWKEALLYSFCGKAYCPDGAAPYAPLIFDPAGHLFGTTASGGKLSTLCYVGCGTVFKLQHYVGRGWKERVLYNFHGYDGQGPLHSLIFDVSGNLYGTAGGGRNACGGFPCGVVFRLTPTSNGRRKETVLYRFTDEADGWLPSSGLVLDKAGNLYGTTGVGGIGGCANGCGVVYRLAPGANGKWQYTVVHRFKGADGGEPGGGVILDGAGNLYGTAYSVVFEITP